MRLVDGWVLSNPDLCARVRVAAVVSNDRPSRALRAPGVPFTTPRAAGVWGPVLLVFLGGRGAAMNRQAAVAGFSQTLTCVPVCVLRLSFRRKLLRPYSHFALGVASARSIPARRGM